mmetsp:Transcript_18730/g.24315  ORF Transcript_18730/g.24315 Transcript_18730/m.24315 type:complete len:390 (+) Transcript_18730:375-1544(+)
MDKVDESSKNDKGSSEESGVSVGSDDDTMHSVNAEISNTNSSEGEEQDDEEDANKSDILKGTSVSDRIVSLNICFLLTSEHFENVKQNLKREDDISSDDNSNNQDDVKQNLNREDDISSDDNSHNQDEDVDLLAHLGNVDGEDPQRESSKSLLAFLEDAVPETELEKKLHKALRQQFAISDKLRKEVTKLQLFMTKRKQVYRRKRKDESAPTRPLSAYNIFVREHFNKLAKENERALSSSKVDDQMKRIAPSTLVSEAGNSWRDLCPKKKKVYIERAKADKLRYKQEMNTYKPTSTKVNPRKRNRTGYNVFFTYHVSLLKNEQKGVPSERGSVARVVGHAWQRLTPAQKDFYEQEAIRLNKTDTEDIPHHPGLQHVAPRVTIFNQNDEK